MSRACGTEGFPGRCGPAGSMRGTLLPCGLLAVLAVAGCATLTNIPATHIVMVNGRGNPVDPTGNIWCREKPESCKDARGESRHLWLMPVEYRQMDRRAPGTSSSDHSPG